MTLGYITDSSVIVSMAAYKTPTALLRRAINSVLNQTHQDLRLVVVNDGGPLLDIGFSDPRLFVLNLHENNGTYFCHYVVTTALRDFPYAYWKMHDSDDWSDPEALTNLLSMPDTGAVFAPFFVHTSDGRTQIRVPSERRLLAQRPKVDWPKVRRAVYSAQALGLRVPATLWGPWRTSASWLTGLFRISRVLAAGGLHPDFRVAYDQYFVRMVAHTGPVAIHSTPTYHYDRTRAHATLSGSRATGAGSKPRIDSLEKQIEIDKRAFGAVDPASVILDTIRPATLDRGNRYVLELRALWGV